MDAYIGTILPWAADWAPNGWHLCDGTLLAVNQYQALYSIIGNIYGGSAQSTFALPDLRGRFPIGMGADAPHGINYALGATHGSNGHVTLNTNNVPIGAHTHNITSSASCTGGGDVPVTLPISIPVNADTAATLTNVPTNNMLAAGKAGLSPANIYTSSTPAVSGNLKSFNVSSNIKVPAPTATITSTCAANVPTGPSATVDIAPNYICINYIIAINGIYPDRP